MGPRVLCSCVFQASSLESVAIEAAWCGSESGTTSTARVCRIAMHDPSAYRQWIDAILSTVFSTSSVPLEQSSQTHLVMGPPEQSEQSEHLERADRSERSRPSLISLSSPSSRSSPLVEVHVWGNVPDAWIRYINGKEGVEARRAQFELESADTFAHAATNCCPNAGTSVDNGLIDVAVRCLLRFLPDMEIHAVHRVSVVLAGGEKVTMMDATTFKSLGIGAVADLLIKRCVTSWGKKRLRQWFAFPSISDEIRTSRLDTIESLVSQPHTLGATHRALRRIGGGSRNAHSVEMMWRNQTLPKRDRACNFLKFAKTLELVEELHECAPCLSEDAVVAIARARFLIETFLDEAQFPDGMCIRYGVCSKLDGLKTTHFGMETMMTRIMAHERDRIPKELLRASTELFAWHIVHVPCVGMFVHVPEGLMPAYMDEILSDWELAFEPGGCLQRDLPGALYTTESCRALNERFGSTMLEIQDREAAFCNQLTDRILNIYDHISSAFDVVADLDCLCVLAELAMDQGMCRPEFSASLSIRRGWHPLMRATSAPAWAPNASSSAVGAPTPNDTEILERSRALVVIGGPGSGKGVYLEQVGITCFLGHIGSFVPAIRAEIPPIDRIFSLDACRESIHDSSFSAGTRVVAEMLRWGSSKSLFLLESFGSATVSCDGVALAAAVVRDLVRTRGVVIFATHMRSCLLDALHGLEAGATCTIEPVVGSTVGVQSIGDLGDNGEFFRVMHLATAKHSETCVPLYALREGEGGEDDMDTLRGDVCFYTGVDRKFGDRVQEVLDAITGVSVTSLDRNHRFSIAQAQEDILSGFAAI